MSTDGTLANVDQAEAWDGDEGAHWVANADRYDAVTSCFTERFAEAAAVGESEVVLDIGCGNGQSTRAAARAAGTGRAVGIDLSSAMLAHARALAARVGVANAEFVHGDAQVFPFERETHDVAISRFGSMFFADPVAAFTNIAGSLRTGGRLTLAVWQTLSANEWFREIAHALAAGRPVPEPQPGVPGPFGLCSPAFVRDVLTRAGFAGIEIAAFESTLRLGSDVDDAYGFVRGLGFARFRLQDLDEAGRAGALAALRATVAAHDTGAGVDFGAAAWMVTAARA